MTAGERRKLVFANLLNGIPVEQVMVAFKLSAKEVMDDFHFIGRKVRSYRFERGMPFVLCDTIENAKANRADILFTLTRINPDKEPLFSRIEMLPFEVGVGRPSAAEQKLLEIRMRSGS